MPTARPSDLPDFEDPPLTEVAVSLQFNQLPGFGYVHLGPLWDRFRSRFGRVQYHPPLLPVFETFGLNQPATQHLQVRIGNAPELPRMWFLADDDAELLQV